MPPPRPPKPEVRAARPERKPSEWSPRPVPTPGAGRSTEDPRTPTRRELAARERVRQASLVADATPTAWLAARLLLDGRPAAGVALHVVTADGIARTFHTDAGGAVHLSGIAPGVAEVAVADPAWPPAPPPDLAHEYVPDVEEYDV